MSTYTLDYSDPLRGSITVVPGGFDGPGGAVASTPLRLYGRGALEWGEAVDENQLRLLENWNGSTPPPYPVAGQFWFQSKFFWLRTGVNWYIFDLIAKTWSILTVTFGGFVGTNTTPVGPTSGQYWFTAGAPVATDAFGNAVKANTLYVFEQEFNQVANGWVERTNTTSAAAPVNGSDFPQRNLLVWDEFVGATGTWVSSPSSISAPPTPAVGPAGSFWWDTTNFRLYVSNGVAWVGCILASGTVPMAAALSMGGFNLTNLPAQLFPILINTTNAASIAYVNDAVSLTNLTATLNATYVNVTGDSMTGDLSMSSAHRVTNLLDPSAAQDAATKNYVDTTFSQVFSAANNTTSFAHKIGDLYIDTVGPIIYIATSTTTSSPSGDAAWKQVWPAQYS